MRTLAIVIELDVAIRHYFSVFHIARRFSHEARLSFERFEERFCWCIVPTGALTTGTLCYFELTLQFSKYY